MKKYSFLIITILLLISYITYSEIKYYNLKRDYIELKYSNTQKIDSLNQTINFKSKEINTLEDNIIILNSRIDSLKKIKNGIIKIPYNVSTSTSGSITQLKNNLKWNN